jgi:HK97 family phage major capsid protein
MTTRKIEIDRVARRAGEFVRAEADQESRTVPLAFSSEAPVERWWGIEVLGHGNGEIDMGWVSSGRAPLLVDHNPRDQIGVVSDATLGTDRKGRAVVRFGSSARAEEIFRDVLDGVRTNVSVGYEILELKLAEKGQNKPDTYRATNWRPLEVSLVSIPADMSVGVGRAAENLKPIDIDDPETTPLPKETRTMSVNSLTNPAAAPVPAIDIEAERRKIADAEMKRIRDITYLGQRHQLKDVADKAIADGVPLDEFRGVVLGELEKRGASKPLYTPPTEVGMSERETRHFSLARLSLAMAEKNPALAPFEWEASTEASKRLRESGVQGRGGQVLPYELMTARVPGIREQDGRVVVGSGRYQRDLSTSTTGAGGATVQTDLLAGDFITLLRNSMMVRAMGATVLSGLVGNVAIPRQTGAATANWVAQAGASTESDAVFAQVTLSPKTVHAIQDYTRELLLQGTPDIEGLIRTDLSMVVGLAVDLAALHGTGASNQPTGIAATAGIGSVAGGPNGLIPTWQNIVDLETLVAQNNAAIDATGYLSNAKVRGRLKTTPKITGYPVFIWESAGNVAAEIGYGTVNGYRAGISNQVSSTLTKGTSSGVCSAIFFGNWRDLLIGEWGGLELLADNVTQAANRIIRMHCYQTIDVAVRRPVSFAAMLDALT